MITDSSNPATDRGGTRSSTSDLSSVRANKLLPRVTPEARRYAVKELARRAGVSRDFFERWRIETTEARTTITFGPELHGSVKFWHTPETEIHSAAGGVPVARSRWPRQSQSSSLPPDLILPFCRAETNSGAPLYQPTSIGGVSCTLDLLRSLLFTLSRIEETLCDSFDEHGRFPASESIAVQHEFLERPIVDELGLAFQQILSSIFPAWQPITNSFQLNLTHDLDDIGIPFQFRTALAHGLKRYKPTATLRDLLSRHTALEPSELLQVRKLARISLSRHHQSAFYWKGSPPSPCDSGYDLRSEKVLRVLDLLRENGFELGVHPGYKTFGDRAALCSEVNRLREALRVSSAGGRQHYLRWNPGTWLDWEACGLLYDSSVGFAERFGFRAGTAYPYRPWSFAHNREIDLTEVPLILMDCTPVKYMKLSRAEGLARIEQLIGRMKCTGGVFTMLWHNTPLLDPDYDGWYEPILNLVSGSKSFDVRGGLDGRKAM